MAGGSLDMKAVCAVMQKLFSFGLYKRSQGRITRQATFAALAIAVALGCWQLSDSLINFGPIWQYGVSGVVLLLGWYFSYRVVNLPRFADFLIAVEAEMNKVTWPSRKELVRSSVVVSVTIFLHPVWLRHVLELVLDGPAQYRWQSQAAGRSAASHVAAARAGRGREP